MAAKGGLLGKGGQDRGLLGNAADSFNHGVNNLRGWGWQQWADALTQPWFGADLYNSETGHWNTPNHWFSNPFSGLFNQSGDPLPAWMQPGAQMPSQQPAGWQNPLGWVGEAQDPSGPQQVPYGNGTGMFPMPPAPPRSGGHAAGGDTIASGQAAQDMVAGMRSPIVTMGMSAQQAQEMMRQMFRNSAR